jgi:hypothetical protein
MDKLALGIPWESRDAAGVAVAIDHATRTIRNADGSTRNLDRVFVCYHGDLLDILPREDIAAAPAR